MIKRALMLVTLLALVLCGSVQADTPVRYDCSNEEQEACGEEDPILDPMNPCNSCYVDFCMSAKTTDDSYNMEYLACDVEFANSCPSGGTECMAVAHLRWHNCYEEVKKRHRGDCSEHQKTLSLCLSQNNC